MVQSSGGLRLQFESVQSLRVPRPAFGQHLDGHVPFQRGVAGAIHFAHSPRTQRCDDFISAQPRARGQLHRWDGLYRGIRCFAETPELNFGRGCVPLRFGSEAGNLEVLTNETNAFNAELGLAQAQANELLSMVEIYRNLGGGWEL